MFSKRFTFKAGAVLQIVFLLASLSVLVSPQPARAAEAAPVMLVVNGDELAPDVAPQLLEDVTYVPVRSVFEAIGATVHYAQEEAVVTIVKGHTELVIELNATQARLNGNKVKLEHPPVVREGHLLVPGRFVAESLGMDVHWDGIARRVYITTSAYAARNGSPYVNAKPVIAYHPDELDLFERVVFAESRDQPYEGYVAVAAVIINRVQSNHFPNTLRDVMLQPGQFSVIDNGTYRWEPDDSAAQAVHEALLGADPSLGALYFFDPSRSSCDFMFSRPVTVIIGSHRYTK